VDSDALEKVRRLGVHVNVGHAASNLPMQLDILVASAAVQTGNPEIHAAQRRGVSVAKYAHMVGLLMRNHRGVAVSGTHGKTTTTAMVSVILRAAGLDPSFVIGGNVPQLSGSVGLGGHAGGGDIFIVEACEFDRSFWNLQPRVAVITNVDRDHMDYFRDDADLVDAFRGFAQRVKRGGVVVLNADDRRAMEAVEPVEVRKVTFGTGESAEWRCDMTKCERTGGRTRFFVTHCGKQLGEFSLRLAGQHNILNALAAIAACSDLGVSIEVARQALAEYCGAERRCQQLGTVRGVIFIDDYAHHPTEIQATLCALRQDFPDERLWCVFQPHQYSRTRLFLDQFAPAFSGADHVIMPDIYAARDRKSDIRAVSSASVVARLRENGVHAEYVGTFDAAVEHLTYKVSSGDVVVTMGAGPVVSVGRALLQRLQADERKVSLAALRPRSGQP
jgi:UDP-N-acetylmuramate--alanine ligase